MLGLCRLGAGAAPCRCTASGVGNRTSTARRGPSPLSILVCVRLLSLLLLLCACGNKNPSAAALGSTASASSSAVIAKPLPAVSFDAGLPKPGIWAPTAEDLQGEPGVLVIGRTVAGEFGPRFAWPGTHIKARFFGTQVSINLLDEDHENEFEVVIDGRRFDKLITVAGTGNYLLADGLREGVHEVVVWRRTETTYEPTEFASFDFGKGGQLLPPPLLSQRRIEVIGDSTTVGYGIEGEPECEASKSNQNNYAAFGSVAARLVGADLVTVAWSGVGVYRNYDEEGPSADTMPALYEYAIATDPGDLWDFSLFEPHVVVVGLGANDFSTRGDPGVVFIEAYVDFLRRIRDNYPDAEIICLIQRASMAESLREVVAIARGEGDDHVHWFDIRVDRGGKGCEGHANVERNQFLGEKLAAELQRVMGWW